MNQENKKRGTSLVFGSFVMSFLCALTFLGVIAYYVAITVGKEISAEVELFYVKILIIPIILGVLSFGVGLIAIVYKIKKESINKNGTFRAIIKIFLLLIILPFFLLWNILRPIVFFKKVKLLGIIRYLKSLKVKSFISKLSIFLAVFLFIFPVWGWGYLVSFAKIKPILFGDEIRISGTGSMFPTFPKGKEKDPEKQAREIVGTYNMRPYSSGPTLFGKNLFSYTIGHGDIVSFSNDKSKEITEKWYGEASGLIKRVVALPGDIIEIRDGIFYLNDIPQKEPYVAQARSTFGNTFLEECRPMTIPSGKIFVMGDNRKGSGDSRSELGLVNYGDIDHVIPLSKQIGNLDKNWHDPSRDLEENHKILFDVNNYVELFNKERISSGLKALRYQPKLEESAKLRGKIILKYNDFSFDAVKSGYTQEKAMGEVGYLSTVYGEAPTQGYYEARELIESQLENLEQKNFLLGNDYQEIGIAVVEGKINGCPTQVIVQHLAGYTPPNYKKSDIEGWEQALIELKKIQPSWTNVEGGEKEDLIRIRVIITQRISNMEKIVRRMRSNQWLTVEEKKMADEDESLFNELKMLTDKVNQGL